MEMESKQATPLVAIECNTLACNECKRKVVDNIEVEQSQKFKADPLMMKQALEIETMR